MADIERIRDLVNESRDITNSLLPDNQKWNMLCSAMDVIGDTNIGIRTYLESSSDGEICYLHIYGLLQVLFVQQDAVKSLAKSLEVELQANTKLKRIRDIRNDISGHPTTRCRDKDFIYLSRGAITKTSLTYFKHKSDDNSDEWFDIDINGLIADQNEGISNWLAKIYSKLSARENTHRQEHRDMKLEDIFHPTLNYLFSKIYESEYNDNKLGQAKAHLKLIDQMVCQFKEALIQRGEGHSEWDRDFQRYQYGSEKLRKILFREIELEPIEIEITCSFLQKYVQKFKKGAQDIDETYSENVDIQD